MPASSQQLSTLINAAKERNLVLSEDDLEILKTAPADSPLSQWLNNFDHPQLLSPEEVRIWECIQDTKPPLPVRVSHEEIPTDTALRNAASDLEASTRRLEVQTEALNAQHSLVKGHVKRNHQQRSQPSAQVNALQRKATSGAQHAHFANDAKASDLKSQLRARLEQLEKETKVLQSRVAETLKGDDRALETLQSTIRDGLGKLAQSPRPEHEQERTELLMKALRKARVDEIKHRLDRVYLESLNGNSDSHHDVVTKEARSADAGGSPDGSDLIKKLQAEIQSLYDEIDDVAGMLVEHEHGSPLRTSLANLSKAQEDGRNRVLSDAITLITNMTNGMQSLTTEVEEKRSEQVLLSTMLKEIERVEKEMSANARESQATKTTVPEPAKALSDLMEHLKLGQAEGVGRGSPLEGVEPSHEAFVHMLESAAQQRRQAVGMLMDAASTTTNVEDGLEVLEHRIAEARAELEG